MVAARPAQRHRGRDVDSTVPAFHPHRPRYLLLFCLRGDPDAHTTLSSIHDVLPHLPADVRDALFEPRFRTAVDESYLQGRDNVLSDTIAGVQTSTALEPGDLLVVDNAVAVHGRSPFTARFDGTDRWLQRTFVVSDLRPSAAERRGRVITTVFGGYQAGPVPRLASSTTSPLATPMR